MRIHPKCKHIGFSTHVIYNKGIYPNKTYINNDKIFNFIPEYLLNHFIRGYFDGDGCIYKHTVSFVCNSSIFLTKIKNILNRITNENKELKQFKNKSYFNLYYHSKNSKQLIFNYLYKDSTIFLERKRTLFKLD